MTVHELGICPRRGCDHPVTVVVEGARAYVPDHPCTGKPYTKKESDA